MKKKNNALRELLLLRKPMTARIPQLVTFPGPKFGKLSPPQQMRRVHNVMRPRNDHIGATFSVPQLSPVMQTSTMATNVSLVVLDDEGNQDDNNGDEDVSMIPVILRGENHFMGMFCLSVCPSVSMAKVKTEKN